MPRIGPGSGAGGGTSEALNAGDYVLAMVALTRRQGRDSGKQYLSCKWEVVAGRSKGASFWDMLGLDVTQPGTVTRWNLLFEACGVTEEFELGELGDDSGRQGDADIRRLFFKRAFVGRVSKERNGDYTNNRIDRVIPRRQWTQEQTDQIFEYITEQDAERDPEELAGDPGDDINASTSSESYEGRETSVASADDFGDDDDIPF